MGVGRISGNSPPAATCILSTATSARDASQDPLTRSEPTLALSSLHSLAVPAASPASPDSEPPTLALDRATKGLRETDSESPRGRELRWPAWTL